MEQNINNSIKEILDYLEDSEQSHFEEDGKPKNHIYNNVVIVRKWLDKVSVSMNSKGIIKQGEKLEEELDKIKKMLDTPQLNQLKTYVNTLNKYNKLLLDEISK